MSCCGQNRQALRDYYAQPKEAATSEVAPVMQNPTTIYYSGEYSLLVKGEITGNVYLFSGKKEGLNIDERDVPAILVLPGFYS